MVDALYLFGAYRLEPEKGLFRGDRQIFLPPKELELLRLLLSLEGRVASHRLIEDTLWPRQVVSYASMARCVYSLRKHLDAEGETYIQTVPKRGYRMVAPLKKEPVDQSTSARTMAIQTTPLAYAHFLEGMREANNPDPESQERAIHWYEEAIKVDREFAPAYAAIADIRIFQTIRGYLMPVDGLQQARAAAEKGLEINPFLVAASAARAWVIGLLDRAPDEALSLLDEALAHDRDYARGYTYRSWLLRILGKAEENLEAVRHAVELDPHSILSRHSLAVGLFYSGRPEEALALEREIRIAHRPDDLTSTYFAMFAAYLGHHEDAVEAAYEALRFSDGNPGVQAVAAYVLATAGESGEARKLVREAESARLPRAPRALLAIAHMALGARAYALELLEQARAERCVWLPPARLDPRLASLADEPRFLALFDEISRA